MTKAVTTRAVLEPGAALSPRSVGLAVSRLGAYITLTLVLLPFQLAAMIACPPLSRAIPLLHHRIGARILGLDIRTEGRPEDHGATLYVANHVSYYDIIVLGALLPGRFVAKREVSGWPGFAQLAWLTRTIYIDRRSRGARSEIDQLRAVLGRGDRLIVFPEGTSSDGVRVLPFKSTLFASVAGAKVRVQPVSVRYTRLGNCPISHVDRPLCAWYGDMDLMPHLWRALMQDRIGVTIRFHPAIAADRIADRKKLARLARAPIAGDLGERAPGLTPDRVVLVWPGGRISGDRRHAMPAQPADRTTIGER